MLPFVAGFAVGAGAVIAYKNKNRVKSLANEGFERGKEFANEGLQKAKELKKQTCEKISNKKEKNDDSKKH